MTDFAVCYAKNFKNFNFSLFCINYFGCFCALRQQKTDCSGINLCNPFNIFRKNSPCGCTWRGVGINPAHTNGYG